MNENMNPDAIIKRTKQYEFQDGLRDIQLGVFFLVFGISFWAGYQPFWWRFLFSVREAAGSFGMFTLALLMFATPALVTIWSQPLIRAVRQRWLWRESGMVKPLRQMIPTWITIMVAVVFVVSFIIGILLSPQQMGLPSFFLWNWLWTVNGWVFGLSLAALGKHLSIRRYLWLGIAGGLASTGLMALEKSLVLPALVFGLGWGVLLTVVGAVVLGRVWPKAGAGELNHVG